MSSICKQRNESDDDYVSRLVSTINDLREVVNEQQQTINSLSEVVNEQQQTINNLRESITDQSIEEGIHMMTTLYTSKDVYDFARDGDVDELIVALNQGNNSTNWYKNKNGNTALHIAAGEGHINIVEILLNRGIDINSKNNDGDTALHWACLLYTSPSPRD